MVTLLKNGKVTSNFLPGHDPLSLLTFTLTLKHNTMHNSMQNINTEYTFILTQYNGNYYYY